MRRDRTHRIIWIVAILAGLLQAAGLGAGETSPFARRRARLMETVRNGLVLIPSELKSRQSMSDNPDFYYLTGLTEPDAMLCLVPGGEPMQVLFRRPQGRPGPARPGGWKADEGLSESPLDQMASTLRSFGARIANVFIPFSDLDFLGRAFGTVNPFSRAESLVNVDPVLSEMRMVKDAWEIASLRGAVSLTAEALNEACRAAEPGWKEIDLAAVLEYTFARRGAESSFLQAASGPNSTNVHFGATGRMLEAGDTIVFDVGVWIDRYTSDISRTIPASGKFTREQRDIYGLVLRAQEEGCRRLVPGVTFKAVQDEVETILLAGLQELGLVTDPGSPWQRRLYIQHGFGHFIGLDIHDLWSYHSPRLDEIRMKPGMVVTMEPGLYFPRTRLEAFLSSLKGKVPEEEIGAFAAKAGPVYNKYADIGVRIEDDVLVTETGNEVLSSGVPKDISGIERLMREKSPHNLLK